MASKLVIGGFMTTKFAQSVLAIALLSTHGISSGATVQFAAPGIVDAIEGLIVNGVTYDVDFTLLTKSQDWANTLDFTNHSDALAAAEAVASVLTDVQATAIRMYWTPPYNFPEDVTNASTFYGTYLDTRLLTVRVAKDVGTTLWSASTIGNTSGPLIRLESYPQAMDFTVVSSVPLPPAVWMFGSGLVALCVVSRRRCLA